ncbi:MAG: hypothetical protein JW938_01145 [Candidatus Omnitrophica bacterium]|nr:hypothetical protein [Candidatus Omnitrophota bacterium]
MRKNIIMLFIFVVILALATPSYALFGSKKEVTALQEQLTLQKNELQKTIDGLKNELATTKMQLEDANKMIKTLNEQLGKAEFAMNEYKAQLGDAPARVEGAVGDDAADESKLASMMNKMKDAITPDEETL